MTAQVRRLRRDKDPGLILLDMEEPINDAVRLATACIMIAEYGMGSPHGMTNNEAEGLMTVSEVLRDLTEKIRELYYLHGEVSNKEELARMELEAQRGSAR